MLDQKQVFEILEESGISFFTGVPVLALKGFCDYALGHFHERNVIAANEENAVGIAAGHFFATGEVPLVYLSGSGLGKIVDPAAPPADRNGYSVPMLLMIGGHSQPGSGEGEKNAGQSLQGERAPGLLEHMQIPYAILEDSLEDFGKVVREAAEYCRTARQPYGLIVPEGVMGAAENEAAPDDLRFTGQYDSYPMSREEAIEVILDQMPADTIYAAAGGSTARELSCLREKRGEAGAHDFLNPGSAGSACSVAFGIALERPDRHIVVLDGDCAAMKDLGALTTVSKYNVPGYMHIILNNGACEAAGGQPSAGHLVDFTQIGKSCGFATVGISVTSKDELIEAIRALRGCGRASLIDCRIHQGHRNDLPSVGCSRREAADTLDSLMKELQKAPETPVVRTAGDPAPRRFLKRSVCNCPQCRSRNKF